MGRVTAIADLPPYARLLVAVRKQRGWSQAELARELCVHRNTVRRWMSGRVEPHPGWQARIRLLLPDLSGTVEAHIEALAALERDMASGNIGQEDAQRIGDALGRVLLALGDVPSKSQRAA